MVIVPAYAKVNLALEVLSRRPDGYHELASVIATVDWHDLVGVTVTATSGRAGARLRGVSGPAAGGVPGDDGNLAVVAANHLLRATEARSTIDIWLEKRLPAQAGLGGGSSDAAAVLRAGAASLATQGSAVDSATLHRIAETLGSDVPALLHGGTTLVGGRGERVTALPAPRLHLAVAVAGESATAAAYNALHADEIGGDGRAERLAGALERGDAITPDLLGSALEDAACRASPALPVALARLRGATPGDAWHLTGSGGAAFALAGTTAGAQRLAVAAERLGFLARACRSLG